MLRDTIRDNFGGAEVRENKTCITVTFTQGGFQSADAAEAATNFFLRDQRIDLRAVGVSGVRVKLYEIPAPEVIVAEKIDEDSIDDISFVEGVDFDTIDDLFGANGDETFSDEELAALKAAIAGTVAAAHEESQLEVLLTKKLDYEVEEFLTGNLSAALELLPESAVVTDDLKQVLTFAYLTGKWSSARLEEIEFLAQYFNNRFQFAAEQFGNG